MAISIIESLMEFRKQPDKGKTKPHKPSGSPKSGKKKENTFKFKKPEYYSNKNVDRPPIKCFLCEGPHHARECPKKNKLLAIMEDKDGGNKKGEEASMGSLQLVAAVSKQEPPKEKGQLYVNMKVGDNEVRALVDTGASNNFH